MADFLLRLDEVEWAAAIGKYEGYLYVSLRTTNRDVNAGDLLQRVLGSEHAGGHDMIAGGRIALPPGADWEQAARRAAAWSPRSAWPVRPAGAAMGTEPGALCVALGWRDVRRAR